LPETGRRGYDALHHGRERLGGLQAHHIADHGETEVHYRVEDPQRDIVGARDAGGEDGRRARIDRRSPSEAHGLGHGLDDLPVHQPLRLEMPRTLELDIRVGHQRTGIPGHGHAALTVLPPQEHGGKVEGRVGTATEGSSHRNPGAGDTRSGQGREIGLHVVLASARVGVGRGIADTGRIISKRPGHGSGGGHPHQGEGHGLVSPGGGRRHQDHRGCREPKGAQERDENQDVAHGSS